MTSTSKMHYKLSALAVLVLSAIAFNSYAEEDYTFDDSFIQGNHSKADLSSYASSELPEGNYSLDVYTNGVWKGRYDMDVKRNAAGKMGACYSTETLTRFGVIADKLNKELAKKADACEMLSEWSHEAEVSDTINKGDMRVDINIPQIYVNYTDTDYVDSSLWDKGIPALNLGWSGNVTNTHNTGAGSADSTVGYLGLNARASIGGWSLHHQGSVNWNDKDGAEWDSVETYLERPIPAISSVASVGQVSTSGEFFDSVRLRGASLKTDTTMYPDSITNFTPEIKGVAQTNATVTVTQSGKVIYQTTVPPGAFSLRDFHPSGYGNDLEVSIKEANGTVTSYLVPYNSGAKLLHPGLFKYELNVGKPDTSSYSDKPMIYQGTVEYGFNNVFTGYTGFTGFNSNDSYRSYLLGVGVSTPLGALSFDATTANSKGKHSDSKGTMYRAAFSRSIEATNTSITVSGEKYSSDGFYNLSDALSINSQNYYTGSKEKSSINLSVNQPLSDGWGSVYANARVSEYWNKTGHDTQYQLAYSNNFGKLYYAVSAQRVKTSANGSTPVTDTRVGLNLSVPFDFGTHNTVTATSNTTFNNSHYSGTSVGLNGTAGEYHQLDYGVSASNGDNKNVAMHAGYRAQYGVVNGSYSQGSDYRQVGLSGSGSVVAHSEGVIFTPESGDTLVIIKAKDGEGAKISSTLGSTIDSNGYAVMSTARPYRVNAIEIDPKGSSDKVAFNETRKQAVPYAGSVVKVVYDTEKQDNLTFTGKLNNGKSFPFGASIYNTKGNVIGSVGQGGYVFIKDASSPTAKVIWKEGSCSFTLPTESNKEVVCQ